MRARGPPGGGPPEGPGVAVATSSGRAYYELTRSLRASGVPFESVLPREAAGYRGVVLTTAAEAPRGAPGVVLYEEVAGRHPSVLRGMLALRSPGAAGRDELVMGVDPGERTGLAVFYRGAEIEASAHHDEDLLVGRMAELLAGLPARRRVVRVGNGRPAAASRVAAALNLRSCASFDLEYVDESGTTPAGRGAGRAGRDVASARSIARRRGAARRVVPASITG